MEKLTLDITSPAILLAVGRALVETYGAGEKAAPAKTEAAPTQHQEAPETKQADPEVSDAAGDEDGDFAWPTSPGDYPVQINGVWFDIDRRPWDAAIDSNVSDWSNACEKATGLFKKKRGLDPKVRAEKIAVLKAMGQATESSAHPASDQEAGQSQAADVFATDAPEKAITKTPPPSPKKDSFEMDDVRVLDNGDEFTVAELLEGGWDLDSIADDTKAKVKAPPPAKKAEVTAITPKMLIDAIRTEGVSDPVRDAALQKFGIPAGQIALVFTRPDLVGQIYAELFGG